MRWEKAQNDEDSTGLKRWRRGKDKLWEGRVVMLKQKLGLTEARVLRRHFKQDFFQWEDRSILPQTNMNYRSTPTHHQQEFNWPRRYLCMHLKCLNEWLVIYGYFVENQISTVLHCHYSSSEHVSPYILLKRSKVSVGWVWRTWGHSDLSSNSQPLICSEMLPFWTRFFVDW